MTPKIAAMSLPQARQHFAERFKAIMDAHGLGDIDKPTRDSHCQAVIDDFAEYIRARKVGLITTPGDEDEDD